MRSLSRRSEGLDYERRMRSIRIEVSSPPSAMRRPVALVAGLALTLVAAVACWPATGHTFYVDGNAGSDSAAGTSPALAWRSLAPVNAHTFGPGDKVLFRSGLSYPGAFVLHGSGKAGLPIVVDQFGPGPKPQIVSGPNDFVFSLYNSEYCEINNLELTGGHIGVFAYVKEFGVAHHLWYRGLRIHDIHGSGDDGGFLCKREGLDTWFDDLLIENCTVEHADRNGILLTDYPTAKDKHHSQRVVIRGNQVRDIGGDGIFILGCDGAVIERNVLRYAHQRVGRGPGDRACAGIWPHRCNNTIIQFNEVSHTAVGGVTVWDSEGFDDDISCTGTIFQYNYSHDNAGGFLLICGGAGTIARYNISQNDAVATFTLESDGSKNATIYNNTIYIGKGADVNFARNTFGAPQHIRFLNNIICAVGAVAYSFGGMKDVAFDHNAFFGAAQTPPPDAHALRADPLLVKPGSGGNGMRTLVGYRLQPGSPCLHAGAVMPGNGGHDFWGASLPAGRPTIGASEK